MFFIVDFGNLRDDFFSGIILWSILLTFLGVYAVCRTPHGSRFDFYTTSVPEARNAVLAESLSAKVIPTVVQWLPSDGWFQCEYRKYGITDKKTGQAFVQAATFVSQLKLMLSPSDNGMTIQGSRSSDSSDNKNSFFYAIEEGFVRADTGRTYWLERSSSAGSVLVSGQFQDDCRFVGEWLSSDGYRGRVDNFEIRML